MIENWSIQARMFSFTSIELFAFNIYPCDCEDIIEQYIGLARGHVRPDWDGIVGAWRFRGLVPTLSDRACIKRSQLKTTLHTEMLSTLDVPFDVWHSILRDVYAEFEAFPSLDDPQYVLSPLHKRLLIHRNLSLVSKHLHELSSSVFLESLELHNPESLLAVSQLLTKDPNLARVVRKLSLNFYEYRCGASMPRRGRELKEFIQEEPSSGYVDPVGQAIARRRLAMEVAIRTKWETYAPSGTRQPNHWVGWTGFVRTILSLCTGVSHVEIDAVADYTQHAQRRNARNYRSLFGSPDLNSTGILIGLLEAKNLHTLRLVDPSPLDEFGSAAENV